MSIDINSDGTATFKIIELSGKDRLNLINNKNLDIPFEWVWRGSVTGDVSGGSVSGTIDLGSINNNVYYVITNVFIFSSSTLDFSLKTNCDQWELFYTSIADRPISLFVGDGKLQGFGNNDRIKVPLYLGRPRQADSDMGKIDVYFPTNTSTDYYDVLVMGYALKHPLPLSTIPTYWI